MLSGDLDLTLITSSLRAHFPFMCPFMTGRGEGRKVGLPSTGLSV